MSVYYPKFMIRNDSLRYGMETKIYDDVIKLLHLWEIDCVIDRDVLNEEEYLCLVFNIEVREEEREGKIVDIMVGRILRELNGIVGLGKFEVVFDRKEEWDRYFRDGVEVEVGVIDEIDIIDENKLLDELLDE